MPLTDYLAAGCVKVPLDSTKKEEAIMEMVDLLHAHGCLKDVDAVKQAMWKRELTRSTGIGHGVAIPHCKTEGTDRMVLALGKPPYPIEYNAVDDKPVGVLFLMASPVGQTGVHIKAMARIARLMDSTEFREAVLEATDAETLHKLMQEVEGSEAFAKSMGVM